MATCLPAHSRRAGSLPTISDWPHPESIKCPGRSVRTQPAALKSSHNATPRNIFSYRPALPDRKKNRDGIRRRILQPTASRKRRLCRQAPPENPTMQPKTASKNRASINTPIDPSPSMAASASGIVKGLMKTAAKPQCRITVIHIANGFLLIPVRAIAVMRIDRDSLKFRRNCLNYLSFKRN